MCRLTGKLPFQPDASDGKNVSIFKTISGLVEWYSGESALRDLGREIAKIIEVLN